MIFIKDNIRKFLLLASIILFVVFLIFIVFDFINYNKIENSAPFYTFLIARTLEFLVPSVVLVIISKIIK